jgi:hypothetical protein
VVFERISFFFHLAHSDVRIKQEVSFRYRNELKIRPKKRIGFVHVDITTSDESQLIPVCQSQCSSPGRRGTTACAIGSTQASNQS